MSTNLADGVWTEARVEMLKAMWADGSTAVEVASSLGGGITRNAVLGKVMRLKLSRPPRITSVERGRGNPGQPKAKDAVARRAGAQQIGRIGVKLGQARKDGLSIEEGMEAVLGKDSAQPFRTIVDAVPVEQRKTLTELTERTCKWPIGDPQSPDFHFCGAPKPFDVNRPYCEVHSRRACISI